MNELTGYTLDTGSAIIEIELVNDDLKEKRIGEYAKGSAEE